MCGDCYIKHRIAINLYRILISYSPRNMKALKCLTFGSYKHHPCRANVINSDLIQYVQWNWSKPVITEPHIFAALWRWSQCPYLGDVAQRKIDSLKGSIPYLAVSSCRTVHVCAEVPESANKHELGPQCCA